MGYYQEQIEKVIRSTDYKGMFKLKIRSDDTETNWMDITPDELIKIRNTYEGLKCKNGKYI